MLDLRIVIEQYPKSISTRSQLASLLHDLFPTDIRLVNVALAVYDCGISNRISTLKSLDSIQWHSFVKQLVDEYGLQESFASEGIEIWANAYGVSYSLDVLPKHEIPQSPSRTVVHNPDAYAKSGDVVTGLGTDYELEPYANGVVISKFRGFEEEHTIIPNYIDGKKVVGIGEKAYLGCQSMKTLSISDGIEFIDDGAFAKCINLTEVVFPETLKRIGTFVTSKGELEIHPEINGYTGAFMGSAVQNVILPSRLTFLGRMTFANCDSLLSIELPDDLTEIKVQTFYKCSKLVRVVLPERLRLIEMYAFWHCHSLHDIQFPNSLQEIETGVFKDCYSLEEIILNEGLKKIGYDAFNDCSSLRKVLMPSTVEEIVDGFYPSNVDGIFTINSWNKKGNEKPTIYCYPGSYGLEYARGKGLPIQNAAKFYNN